MRIASWNVNSAKARQDHILNYLRAGSCDVLLIQETKTQDVNFPADLYAEIGWNVVFHGQKSYNGVAIASRLPIEDPLSGLAGDPEDEQARYMEATIGGVRVATIYLPNGNPAPGPKFDYKIAWMARLRARAAKLLAMEMPVVLAGDFNVIPQDIDCYDPPGWEGDALTHPDIRACHPGQVMYSYWDYQAGAWQKDNGVRIDHLMLSPEAADRITGAGVDKGPRGEEKPSDHTPVWVELSDPA